MLPNIYITEEATFTVFKGSVLFPPVVKPLFQNQENRSLKKYIFEMFLFMYFLVLQNIDSGCWVRRCIHNYYYEKTYENIFFSTVGIKLLQLKYKYNMCVFK